MDHYEINVSRNGHHLFATAERSLQYFQQTVELFNEIKAAFPDCRVSVSKITTTGTILTPLLGDEP